MRHLPLVVIAVGLSLVASACGKERARPDSAATTNAAALAPSGEKTAPSSAALKASRAERAALARVFALSRCVMIGVLSPDPKHYSDNGFADDAAFRAEFLAASRRDAMWARGVVDRAMHAPCSALTSSGGLPPNGAAEKKP